MQLDPAIYVGIQELPHAIWIALLIVCLASLSESLGRSVVLFVNQVRPRRFVMSLGISALSNIIGFVLWTLTVWLLIRYAFGIEMSIVPVVVVVGLAHSPQLLAFFELIPFLGNPFSVALSLWSTLAIIVAMVFGLGLAPWQAIGTGILGWILIQLWRRSLGRPIYALGHSLQSRIAGKPMLLTLDDLQRIRHDSKFVENLMRGREVFSRPNIHELARRTALGSHFMGLEVSEDQTKANIVGGGAENED